MPARRSSWSRSGHFTPAGASRPASPPPSAALPSGSTRAPGLSDLHARSATRYPVSRKRGKSGKSEPDVEAVPDDLLAEGSGPVGHASADAVATVEDVVTTDDIATTEDVV